MPIQRCPHPFNLGSSASRNPSPNRLNASTVMNIARLGKIATCGAITISARASLSIAPHSGVGGWAPRPKNDRLAAVMIEVPMISCLDHAPIHSAKDANGETLFAFRASCSYRLRLEAWFKREGARPGQIMEIQSYHAMLACVASGAGLAMIPHSVLSLLPGHERVRVHTLPPDVADTATWLLWRRDAFGPNVRALKELIIEQTEIAAVDESTPNDLSDVIDIA